MTIQWNLLGAPVDVGGAFQRGFDQGTARRQSAEDRRYMLDERGRVAEAREARSAFMLAGLQGNALAPRAFAGAPGPAQPNALSAPHDGPAASLRGIDAGAPDALLVAPGNLPGTHGTSIIPSSPANLAGAVGALAGAPQSGAAMPVPAAPAMSARDEAFARFIKLDPEGAATMRREEATEHHNRLQNFERLSNMGMQLLAGVSDQASYDRARQQARALYARYGEDTATIDNLPAQWAPELSEQLRMQGMNTQRQLAGLVQQSRLRWDIQDDEADNERADGALEDLSLHRRESRGLTARGQDLTDRRGRRGQDLASTDRRSGQASTDARTRRGQDMTDARVRRGQDLRGQGRQPGRAGRAVGSAPVARGPDGRRYTVRDGQWVPIG